MKLSYKWLKEFIDTELSPKEIADKLTMGGIEVSAVINMDKGIRKVITAEIRDVQPHPNADKLTFCKVFNGQAEVDIVCGAKNIKPGDRVPLATVGAVLPGNKEINEAEIRGKKSYGMLCSERELGLSEEHAGIMILPQDTPLGLDINTVLELDDVILEAEPTPNRGDCLSVLGLAREIAAILNLKIKMPKIVLKETADKAEKFVTVEIKDENLCPRYAARFASNVKVKTSPLWMQNRLRNCGLRPINNIVDITNYVLLELGHPLHAFDSTTLQDAKIIVRTAREGEEIQTLDGQTRKLTKHMLVIADSKKPVALAGVMGGELTGVKENSTTVVLESAYFDPVSIRKTARSLGLSSDASYHFERGVDVDNQILALNRAAQMVQDLAEGAVAKGIIDTYPHKLKQPKITLRQDRINKILGVEITFAQSKKILKNLGFAYTENTSTESFHVLVPPWRHDIEREIDLIEEVARLNGYEEIPAALPKGRMVKVGGNRDWQMAQTIAQFLRAAGFAEIISYSFIGEKDYAKTGIDPAARDCIKIANPLTEDVSIMRTSLVCGLLNNLAWNINHGSTEVKIFEQGRVFLGRAQETYAREDRRLALAVSGHKLEPSWNRKAATADSYYLKGLAVGLLDILGIAEYKFQPSTNTIFHPALSLDLVLDGQVSGTLGRLSPRVAENYDFPQEVYLAEFDLEKILSLATTAKKFHSIPKFPGIRRDLALSLPIKVSHETVMNQLRRLADPLVREVALFDVYQGDKMEAGFKSYAYTFLYQAQDRTLQDEEVNKLHQELVRKVIAELGAKVR